MKWRASLAVVLAATFVAGSMGPAVAQGEQLGWRGLDVSGIKQLGTPFAAASDGAATVIVGARETGSGLGARTWSSPDGLSGWEAVDALSAEATGLPTVTLGSAGFLAAGMSAPHRSADGSGWTEVARSGLVEATLAPTSMGYLMAGWLPRSEGGIAGVAVNTSTDGSTWSTPDLLLETDELRVPTSTSLADGTLIVVVPMGPEDGGPGVAIFGSVDAGATWQRGQDIPSLGGTPTIVRLGQGAGRIYAVVSVGDAPTAVLTSIDGSDWTVVPELSGVAHVVGSLGDMAVALGNGVVLSSADGLEWTRTRQPALAEAGFTATVELADGRILATGLTDANGSTRPAIWVGEPATVANSASRFAELYDAWDAALDRIWKGRKSVPLKTLKKRARADIAQTQRLLSGLRSWPWPEEVRAEAEAYISTMERYQQTGRKLSRAPDSRRWRRLIKTDKAQRSAQTESYAAFTVALGLADS